MKSMLRFIRFAISKNLWRIFLSTLVDTMAVLFSAGLYGLASFLISLSALRPGFEAIAVSVVGVRFFGLGRAGLRYLERLLSHDTTFRILRDLRTFIYDKIVPRLPDLKEGTRHGNLVAQAIADVETLQEAFLRVTYPWAVAGEVFLLGVGVTYAFHPLLALAFVLTYFPISFMFPVILTYLVKGMWNKTMLVKLQLYQEFIEFASGIRELQTNSREGDWKDKLFSTIGKNEVLAERNNRQAVLANTFSVFFQGLAMFVFVIICCWLTSRQELDGTLTAAGALTAAALFEAAVSVFQSYLYVEKVTGSADRIFEGPGDGMAGNRQIEALSKKQTAGTAGKTDMEEEAQCPIQCQTLAIHNLSYSYSDERTILEDFSMTLQRGQIKAIAGESGIGKSTLLNLISGFLKESTGKMEIDGTDLTLLEERQRHRYFSVVEQSPYFFNTTIRENMKIAKPEATEDEILAALERGCILEFVRQLPQGLDTLIAESGASLSAGELQRMAIARVLLRDAPFILLDEPTAGLDTLSERKIMDLLLELKRDKGVLIVTHRPVMLDLMDEVICFEK